MKKTAFMLAVILCLPLLCPVSAQAVQPEDINVVMEPTLDSFIVTPFREGLAMVMEAGKWSFIDTSGNIAITLNCNYVDWFEEGLAAVQENGKWGFIDTSGNLVISLENDNIKRAYNFREGLAEIEGEDGKCGLIDAKGNIVVPMIYDFSFWGSSEGLMAARKDEKWGFIDGKGNTVIPFEYDDTYPFSEGLAGVKKGEKWGFIDRSGNTVIPFEFEGVGEFSKGLAPVRKGSWEVRKWGFVDTGGNVVIPFEYTFVHEFSEGLAAVNKNEKWGFINTSGNVVIPLVYDEVTWIYLDEIAGFCEGLSRVKKDEKWGFIDINGDVVVPIIYDSVNQFNQGYVTVEKDGKWGILHNTAYGKSVEPAQTVSTAPQIPFNDVQAGAWYAEAVKYVFTNGLMNGTAADKFSPDATLTRAMLVTILFRQAGESDMPDLASHFDDVSAGTWYDDAVKWAAQNGMVTGYGNGKFGPNDALTHEQVAAILRRFQQYTGKIPPDILLYKVYPDFNGVSDYARDAVTKLTMQGIFRDIPGVNFNPKVNATRAEVAAMLYRFLTSVEVANG